MFGTNGYVTAGAAGVAGIIPYNGAQRVAGPVAALAVTITGCLIRPEVTNLVTVGLDRAGLRVLRKGGTMECRLPKIQQCGTGVSPAAWTITGLSSVLIAGISGAITAAISAGRTGTGLITTPTFVATRVGNLTTPRGRAQVVSGEEVTTGCNDRL